MLKVSLIACALLLQEDVAPFLAELEKQRLEGVEAAVLIEKIDRQSAKSEAVRARLAWNRAWISADAGMNAKLAEDLATRIGQVVEFGDKPPKLGGKVVEVKPDRFIAESGTARVEVQYQNIPPLAKVAYLKGRQKLADAGLEGVLARAAAGDVPGAVAQAEKADLAEALDAVAGLILQGADKDLAAKRYETLAKAFATTWLPRAKLLEASTGFREFAREALPRRLLDVHAEAAKLDRKAGRRLLELGLVLAEPSGLRGELRLKLWSALDKGEWMSLAIEGELKGDPGRVEGGRIVLGGSGVPKSMGGSYLVGLPMPLAEISGFRARFHPVPKQVFQLAWDQDTSDKGLQMIEINMERSDSVVYVNKEGEAQVAKHRPLPRKADYELRMEWGGGKLRTYIDAAEQGPLEIKDSPCERITFYSDLPDLAVSQIAVRKK